MGLHGLVLFYAGAKEAELLPLSLGVVTITGFIGILGAWKRIYSSSEEMSEKEKSTTRIMLLFGCLSSFGLSAWAFNSSEPESAIILLLLALGAVAFIYATPKNRN